MLNQNEVLLKNIADMTVTELKTAFKSQSRYPGLAALDPSPGYRARIGIMLPSRSRGAIEQEYWAFFPQGVAPLITRLMLTGELTPENLIKMSEEVEHCTALLKTAEVDVISYTCTSGAFVMGPKWDQEKIDLIERVSGAKGTSMARSVLEAFRALGAKKVIMAAPYVESIIAAELKYYAHYGIDITYHESLDILNHHDLQNRSPYMNYEFAHKVWLRAPEKVCEEADVLFLSCGAMRSIEIIEELEQQVGLPIVTSNQANAWHCLKLAGIREPLYGLGKLMRMER